MSRTPEKGGARVPIRARFQVSLAPPTTRAKRRASVVAVSVPRQGWL